METTFKKLRDRGNGSPVRVSSVMRGLAPGLWDSILKRSVIKRFDPSGWGSILKDSQEERGDYFYIDQVRDDTRGGLLLRLALCLGIGKGLEVSYRLGQQTEADKKIAASDIELTDNGIRKAEALLNRMKTPCKGYLAYRPYERTWTLESAEAEKRNALRPDESAIRDPYLKKFCLKFPYADEQFVTFYLDEQSAPFNVCGNRNRMNPEPYGVGISEDDARAWEDYERALSMSESLQDPYPNHPFHSLAPLEEDAEAPLT